MILIFQAIQFIVNVQHDCLTSKCKTEDSRQEIQERQATERTTPQLIHSDDDRFILNMHAMHNAHLIRRILPRELTAPVPVIPVTDRAEKHSAFAEQLRLTNGKKRSATKEKAERTRMEKNDAAGKTQQTTGVQSKRKGKSAKSVSALVKEMGRHWQTLEAEKSDSGEESAESVESEDEDLDDL